MELTIRNEKEQDFRAVEELIRKAFWNVYVPGCNEHYLAHILRAHKDFIPELDFVAETPDGEVIGNIMYTKSKLTEENGTEADRQELQILTFGPLSVHPAYQRMGVGKKLLEHSFDQAAALGYGAIVIFGNPGNYVSRGFKSCRKYSVCSANGTYPTAMLVKELKPGILSGRKWSYQESPAYEFSASDAEKFDKLFPPAKKEVLPSQEEFYIYSHSVIE